MRKTAASVNHPSHYCDRVPGIECIDVTQHFNFNIGNAFKYLWRHDSKGNPIEDLEKAKVYVQFEIDRLSAIKDQKKRKNAKRSPREIRLPDAEPNPWTLAYTPSLDQKKRKYAKRSPKDTPTEPSVVALSHTPPETEHDLFRILRATNEVTGADTAASAPSLDQKKRKYAKRSPKDIDPSKDTPTEPSVVALSHKVLKNIFDN